MVSEKMYIIIIIYFTSFKLGILEFMSPEFVEHWHKDALQKNFNISKLPVLKCRTFPDIVHSLNISHIDIYVLDVEGAEMTVLNGMDKVLKPPVHSDSKDYIWINVIYMECDTPKKAKSLNAKVESGNLFKCYYVTGTRACMCKRKNFQVTCLWKLYICIL